ncbi:DUF3397 family protein [Virgibacillus sp. W0430]|uniref:DUF3397 family protein n=1 Tax=Virgibacillus sp. W0430 TaxID=3391580 RepID=UPI003F47C743
MNEISILLITIPIIATWLFYKLGKRVFSLDWRAFHFAVNSTTLFYILAVNILAKHILQQQFVGITIILLLVILAIVIIIQWKKNTEVVLWKGLKTMWRLAFLLFFFLYICGLVVILLLAFLA